MNLETTDRSRDLAGRVDRFVREEVFPLEREMNEDGLTGATLDRVRSRARDAGLWAPQLPQDLGGQGLDFLELVDVFEAAGQSLLGPLALGCAAPDEGNAHLLHKAGSDSQKTRYLEPLARGEIRSAFAMTEPMPGAGSDPGALRTRATRTPDGWRLDGEKWFTTGADGAAFLLVAAVSDVERPVKEGVTIFLVEHGTPGLVIERRIPTAGGGTPGGHCEVRLDSCQVGDEAILGGVHEGFRLLQARLGPARLTHCMRWIGAASRCLEIARDRAREREAFGAPIASYQGIQWMLADSAIELHAARLMTREAAQRVARGERARRETSMCKVFVAESVHRIIDRAMQICGALGYSHDLPIARMFDESRAFRIYDGPSEVHRMVIAREILRDGSRSPDGHGQNR